MKLDSRRFAIAVASVAAIAGLLCAPFYKASPGGYNRAANFLVHSDMFASTRTLGWGDLLAATATGWVFIAAGLPGRCVGVGLE